MQRREGWKDVRRSGRSSGVYIERRRHTSRKLLYSREVMAILYPKSQQSGRANRLAVQEVRFNVYEYEVLTVRVLVL